MIKIIRLKNNENKFVRSLYKWPLVRYQNIHCSENKNVKNFGKIIKIGNGEDMITKMYNFENVRKHNIISVRCFSTNLGNVNKNVQNNVKNVENVENEANECEQTVLGKNEKRQKTTREIYMDRKQRESIIKMYLFLSLILMPFGYMYMYCIEKNINTKELIQIIKKKCEHLESQYNEIIQEFIDKYFPVNNEPLLPDFKDLNYPENLPTLVIDLNYVIAKLEYNRKTGWRVLKRPYSDLFFKELSSFYEIVIWSDDNFPVAQEVISKWGIPAIGCLHRDQCSKKKKYYIKDLNRLGRNLDRVVIIDHDIHAFMLQPENGILIKEFHGDVDDNEMLCLIDLLKSFAISSHSIGQFLQKYGGGDYNIGKRYLQQKNDAEQKSQRIRSLGKIFHVDNKKPHSGMSFSM
ncbi:hypothetical protein YYC_02242 [Plasmodium yoelii 17X]|uniref:Mitochondrial import inner membrane translocase subunit TIM50 n=1 Tax=Plasmodium yoelii 17X TaxID=1323249 RepID=V7PPF1_PLAYE|nr:hypothetical protein YYC_02242 [Plasmodium yoelii 17X]